MLAGCADGGDAVSLLQVSAARVEVGKNGLTADGRIPSIEVESDGYWRVFAESSAAWVRTDPSAASGSCTVTLSVEALDRPLSEVTRRADALSEVNPMLGMRGVRLGVVLPEIYDMQAQAIF